MIRTRIAPSPTGHPHIGTIYQILFNYAYAKHNNGSFIVRTEDTDKERLVKGAEEELFTALDWFGLTEDESTRKKGKYGPYRQSERLSIYEKYALQLIEKGHAYYCYCTKERLEHLRKEQQKKGQVPKYDKHCLQQAQSSKLKVQNNRNRVIRLNVPKDKEVSFIDGIRGKITFNTKDVDDQVLIKSDGYPTYHLAVVVDDYLMKISHVVRGEEWISSTPKHILLYDFFGWEKPLFFHTSLLRNPDKSKLSKRHGHTDVTWYKSQGFLPEAIVNFLALMGWSNKDGKELISIQDFISQFDLKDLKAVGPIFDIEKLKWMNGEYIRAMSTNNLQLSIFNFHKGKYPKELIKKTIPLVQERIKTFVEYDDYCRFFIKRPDPQLVLPLINTILLELPTSNQLIADIHTLNTPASSPQKTNIDADRPTYVHLSRQIDITLSNITKAQWNSNTIGKVMQDLAKALHIPNNKYFMILRLIISGSKITPPLNESMEILGKEECLARLQNIVR